LAQTSVGQMKVVSQSIGWGAGVLAGAGAGIAAALACVAVELVLRARVPPTNPTAWSAFVAGVLGGIVYAGLSRVVSRPALALWIVSLAVATVDSIFIIALPLPAGPNPKIGIPIVGLMVPLRQAAALLGMGHLGDRHFPAEYLVNVTAIHYVTAVAVSLLVPWWAGRKTQ
jgi:hypothetical protein